MQEPTSFGRYEVRGVVGEGSMGRVYLAFDPLGQRQVAVKTLHPEYRTGPDAEEFMERFRREAQSAGALMHPNIITVFDVGEDYFVMELLEGETVQQLLYRRGRLELAEALPILVPVAQALEYAHARGTIHRDVKPSNIMLLADGRPKLMDFGVAHLSSRPITVAGRSLGSPSYMAPEQIDAGRSTPGTDLFSFGVVAYEMLTGRKPFEGPNVTTTIRRVLSADPEPPTQHAPELHPLHDVVFSRALSKRPEDRYAGPVEFVSALQKAGPRARDDSPDRTMPVDLGEPEIAGTVVDLPSEQTSTLPSSVLAALRLGTSSTAAVALALVALAGVVSLWLTTSGPVPAARYAGLQVRTQPPGARLEIDSRHRGATPLDIGDLEPGLHHVRVLLEGHAPAELRLELSAGATVPLQFDLVTLSPPGPGAPREHRAAVAPARAAASATAAEAPAPSAVAAPPAQGPISLAPGTFPKRISGELPVYPDAARRLKLEGRVAVEMVIDERGNPTQLRIRESAGEILDRAVLEAIRTWRYEPTLRDGRPVRVRHAYRHSFRRD